LTRLFLKKTFRPRIWMTGLRRKESITIT
jgi:3'-phosphoadenosine 5'-phosphosulfate sulfotransferase (PAPS reductase)/FAD synthetase